MIQVKCETKNFEFKVKDGSQSVVIVNRKVVSEEEMRNDLEKFTHKYKIKSFMNGTSVGSKTKVHVFVGSKPKVHVSEKIRKKVKKEEYRKSEIPEPAERKKEILENMSAEFSISDVGKFFARKGYDKMKIMNNVRPNIRELVKQGKLKELGGMPKKYIVVKVDVPQV